MKNKTNPTVSELTLNPKMISDTTENEMSPEEVKMYEKQRTFLMNIAKPSFTNSANARRRYDQEWLSRNLFWRGYQFNKYLPNTQTVVLSSRQNSRVPVNYLASSLRAIRNQVTSFRPKWEVMPAHPTEEYSKNQARYIQRLLDYIFDHLKLKVRIKETLTQALLYSIGGPWQIVYDEVRKEVRIWLVDPFDFYPDPLAEDYDDANFMIKAVRRPIAEIVHNPDFNILARKEVTSGSMKLAASEYKQFMIQALKVVSPRMTDDADSEILYEGDFRRYDDNGKPYLVKCIWTDQNTVPLYFKETDESDYDYAVYRGDINPKDIFGESWAKHVMPLNRTLNSLETSAFEYNYRVAKGRILVDRDAGVRAIHNVHGEIISKNRGAEVKSLDMAPLPVAVPQQIERMWRYIEDVSGIHEASLGRIPTGVKSGVGIAELKQADATSQDDLVDNLEDFLEDVAKKILHKIAKNYTTPKVIKDLGVREGDQKYFAVVAKNSGRKKSDIPGHENQIKIGPDWLDLVEIDDDNAVRVMVGSWLGYTKEAMQQKVISYFQMQLIDQQTALKLLEFGDIDSIVQQTRIEALLKRTQPQQPGQQPQPDQMSLAMTENEMLLEGKEMPVSENDDHMVHIAIHQDALMRGMDDIVGAHIQKHQFYLGSSTPIPTAAGTDFADAARTAMTNQPAPVGPPPGQGLPQQNIPAAMEQVQNTAAANVQPGVMGQ